MVCTETIESSESTVDAHANNFNFLRLLFATAVIFSHSFPMVGSRAEPLENLVGRQTYSAELAVNGFFAISGLLVTESWLRSRGLLDYLKKRILRIYPGYLVAALFCLLVAAPLGSQSPSAYFREVRPLHFLAQIAQLSPIDTPPTFTGNPLAGSVNGSLWTIKIEFECYLLVAAAGLLGLLRRRTFILTSFIALALLSAALHDGPLAAWAERHMSAAFIAGGIPKARLVTYFLAGMVFCLYRDRIRLTRAGLWISLAITVAAAVAGMLTAILPFTGAFVLFYAAYVPNIRLRRIGRGFDLSYGVYLYAWPIQQLMVGWTAAHIGPYALFSAAAIASYMVAALSWKLIEQPSLRLKGLTRYLGPRTSGGPRTLLP